MIVWGQWEKDVYNHFYHSAIWGEFYRGLCLPESSWKVSEMPEKSS